MAAFQPKGETARWRVIYELLRTTPTGDVLGYEAIGDALGLHPETDRHTIQMAMRRASREHEETDKRAVEPVPNTGYRVVDAPEHLRLARSQQRRAGRALSRGQSKVVNVDLSGVDPETRHAFEVVARAFALQKAFNDRLDMRQKHLEQAVSAMSERTERTEQEIADLKARLARIEGA